MVDRIPAVGCKGGWRDTRVVAVGGGRFESNVKRVTGGFSHRRGFECKVGGRRAVGSAHTTTGREIVISRNKGVKRCTRRYVGSSHDEGRESSAE